MTKNKSEAAPLAQSAPISKEVATQWFALHYAADADPSLPRTIFASEVQTVSAGDVLRFFVTTPGNVTYPVLDLPAEQVERVAAYVDLRAALEDAFAAESGTAA